MRNRVKGGLALGSAALIGLLATWEGGGGGMTVYPDKLANNLPTTCYGITRHITDEPVIIGEYWDKGECERVVKEALVKVQTEVKSCLTHSPPQSVFDAVSSLAWNVGARSACNSQSVKYINQYDYVAGCNLLSKRFDGRPNWSYVGTTYVQGLQNRRLAETNLCLSGIELEIEPEVPPKDPPPPMNPDNAPEQSSKCDEDAPDA